MPAKFNQCVRTGGRVRTIITQGQAGRAGAKYIHVCYQNGKSYSGHVHTSQKRKR